MSEDEDFSYKIKFKDMRIKPKADEKSRARAEASKKVCEHKSCDLAGEFPAPMRNSNGKHWFCQRHAAEYNRSFNFFENMTENEIAAFNEQARSGFKQTWKFGTGPVAAGKAKRSHDPRKWKGREFFDGDTGGISAGERAAQRGRTRLQLKALDELDLASGATASEIRVRYAEYVRRFHPDSNAGDRSSEEKLNRVIRAGKVLKQAGLMKG